MNNLRSLLSRLSTNFSMVKSKIRMENLTNDMSLNIILETRILEVYNYSTGLNLKNSNLFNRNSPGVDGIDEKNKVMAQVTSTFSNEKIENTIKKVLETRLHEKYNRLVFIILNDKQKLTEDFKKKIKTLINGKFHFDFNNDIVDLNDLYRLHSIKQEINNIHKSVSLLDDVLEFLPEFNESGFGSVCVCFHEEELNNVFEVVDILIKEGRNVYLNSKKLCEKFKSEKHPLADFIIYADPLLNLSNVEFCIVVLSNSFIHNNFISSSQNNKCHLFTNAVNQDIKIEAISFDRFVKSINKIPCQQVHTYQTITKSNISNVIESFIKTSEQESFFSTISPDEIVNELINANHNFQVERIHDDIDYILLSFIMEQQEDLKMNYIILKKDYVLNRVISDYTRQYKSRYNKNLNVLVPKDFQQKTRRRLDIVMKEFPDCRVFFIDEHLFDKKYKSLEQSAMISTKDFITPVVRDKDELLGINDIIHWIFNNSKSSIAIIYGSGGIGKTTVSEKIHDIILEEHERNIIIFIRSTQYIEVFKKAGVGNDAEYDLFSIFKQCHSHASKIDKNSFYLNYALGNIIIIFDGIDEIISTIPSFNLYQFIENLENLRKQFGKGKILINCRDSYINDLLAYYRGNPEQSKEKYIKVYELLGFNNELSLKFFSKHFKDNEKQELCVRLLKEFYPNHTSSTAYQYPPFVLEIIVEIAASKFDFSEIETENSFSSTLLLPNEQNDVVIFHICNREVIKKEEFGFHLSVDEQIKFFYHLAIEEKGEISINSFDKIVTGIGINDRIQDVAKGIADHPLLVKIDGIYKFRFGFFNNYFKSVYLQNLLTEQSSFLVTDRLIYVFVYDCNYNSVLYKTLIARLNCTKIEFIQLLKNTRIIFDKINVRIKSSDDKDFREKCKIAISNLLLVILKYNNSKAYSTSVIFKELFGELNTDKNIISNLYLINVPATVDFKIDFSGNLYTHTEIIKYSDFFKCNFDADTFFDENCTIREVFNEKLIPQSIQASLENFDRNIKGDNSIFKILSIKGKPENLVLYFKDYLKSFREKGGGSLIDKLNIRAINSIQNEFISNKTLTEILLANKIVSKFENNEVHLDKSLEIKILKFLSQGLPFTELKRSIRDLEKVVKVDSRNMN